MKAFSTVAVLLALALLPLSHLPAAAESSAASSETTNEDIVTRPKLGRAVPFKSVVFSVDPEGKNFRMGKKKVRLVYVMETTRFLKSDGSPANVTDLKPGVEIRGSTRKRDTGELEAVTVKIGPKNTKPYDFPKEAEEGED